MEKMGGPAMRVQLRISAMPSWEGGFVVAKDAGIWRGLAVRDSGSASDPMAVLFTGEDGVFEEAGRTERVPDSTDVAFATLLPLHYYFEAQQPLRIELFDVDGDSTDLSEHDFLGRLEVNLGAIVGAPASRLTHPLTGKRSKGDLTVEAEEVGNSREVLTLELEARKLDNKDFFGKSDPFLCLHRINDDQSMTLVHRTEVIDNDLNPKWKAFSIPVYSLSQGNPERRVHLECWDKDRDGGHDLIGNCRCTLAQLTAPGASFELVNPKKAAKKKAYQNSGTLTVRASALHTEYSFLDFVRGGTQLHFTVAVDFTASNGNPALPESLHHIDPVQPNQYMIALKAVGDIISDYDADRLFPALGFGGRLPDGSVSHEFFLNSHPTDPHCRGVEGVLEAYKQSLSTVQLYGPTNFAPIIRHVAKFAASTASNSSHYFVLLIITDGAITDLDETLEAIVQASSLPLSIIVVGVGEADFEAMEALDCDGGPLRAPSGDTACRDIVQFVQLREYLGSGGDWLGSQARLAREVLREVPAQLTAHFNASRIPPPSTAFLAPH